MRRVFWIVAALMLSTASSRSAHAQVTLATSTVSAYKGGTVTCSAVNVGAEGDLDITVTLVDADTGQVVETETGVCTTGSASGSVASGKRCKGAITFTTGTFQILWCKIEVNLPGNGSTAQNPSLAALAQRVRGSIASQSSTGPPFVALPAF